MSQKRKIENVDADLKQLELDQQKLDMRRQQLELEREEVVSLGEVGEGVIAAALKRAGERRNRQSVGGGR